MWRREPRPQALCWELGAEAVPSPGAWWRACCCHPACGPTSAPQSACPGSALAPGGQNSPARAAATSCHPLPFQGRHTNAAASQPNAAAHSCELSAAHRSQGSAFYPKNPKGGEIRRQTHPRLPCTHLLTGCGREGSPRWRSGARASRSGVLQGVRKTTKLVTNDPKEVEEVSLTGSPTGGLEKETSLFKRKENLSHTKPKQPGIGVQ